MYITKKKQKGYATILAVVLFAVLGLSTVGLFSSTQLTFHKQKEQNAADAAAYSIATLTARDLNLISYTNRAMIANQVAIGQMVSLASWTEMLYNAAVVFDWVATSISWVPVLGQIVKSIAQALKEGSDALREIISEIAKGVIPFLEFVNSLYSESQRLFHVAMLASAPKVYEQVVETNDPDAELELFASGYSIAAYLRDLGSTVERNQTPKINGYSDKQKRYLKRYDEFAGSVKNSFDRFSRRRDKDWFSARAVVIKSKIDKEGGTEFDRDKGTGSDSQNYVWEWNAMDTLALSVKRKKLSGGWKSIINIPLGWGAAHALHESRNGDYYDYSKYNSRRGKFGLGVNKKRWGHGAWQLKWSAWLATTNYGTNNLEKVAGLKEFYDIKEDSSVLKEKGRESRGPAMLVLLKKPMDKVKNARGWKKLLKDHGNSPGGRVDIERDVGSGDVMYALAKAEAYYLRPNDGGASHFWRSNRKEWEYGNLYNPYWQPRLVKTTTAERVGVLALVGIQSGS